LRFEVEQASRGLSAIAELLVLFDVALASEIDVAGGPRTRFIELRQPPASVARPLVKMLDCCTIRFDDRMPLPTFASISP